MYIAKISFAGKVVGMKGKPINLTDKALIKDLLNAGYIEEVGTKTPTPKLKSNKKK